LYDTTNSQVKLDRVDYILTAVVAVISLVFYLKTLAMSVSFWDCGEFVACSRILGIPHPPGSPVYILFGRIFSLIPFGTDIAYRINMLSALSAAAAVGLGYMIVARIIARWGESSDRLATNLPRYVGGVTGTLFMAFCRTFWINAVEAEVYGLTALVFTLVLYLMVRWSEDHTESSSDRFLIAASYFSVLGTGIHLTAFLVIPAAVLFIPLVSEYMRKQPLYWITALLMMSVAYSTTKFVYIGLIWLVICAVFLFKQRRHRMWRFSAAMILAGVLGFSIQTYVPVRTAFDPPIDMNDPANWEKFERFVERKQYGEENMIPRMFNRRGELSNQFGDFPRMGFWRFFSHQYSKPDLGFYALLIVGIFGLYSGLRRHLSTGALITLLALAGTIGLTLYMNFADGTQIDPRSMLRRLEVRDRDYFWAAGFAVFGLAIGLGAAAIVRELGQRISKAGSASAARPALIAASVVLLAAPALAINQNYRACDKSMDTLPFDYAWNVLNTCGENALLFTAGDNDTFSLWALQWCLGIRQDVRIVNLSLLDTDWYALHLKHVHNVPISLTDEQLITYPTEIRGVTIPVPKEPFYDPIRKEKRFLYAFPDNETGAIIRVAHQLSENILLNNNWKDPVYFANYPPSEIAFDLNKHTKKVGVLFEVTNDEYNLRVDLDESYRLFTEVYQFRNLTNPKYYRNETMTNFALGMGQKYYDAYSAFIAAGDTARAAVIFDELIENIPEYWQSSLMRSQADAQFGRTGKTKEEYDAEYLEFVEELLKYAPESFYYKQYKGLAYQSMGRMDEAIVWFEKAFEQMPTNAMTYRALTSSYITAERYAEAAEVSRYFLFLNPTDQTAKRLLNVYQQSGGN